MLFMDYQEFRRQLGKAGLTGREFARLLEVHPNTITNYKATGRVPYHMALIAGLVADMAERRIDFRATIESIRELSTRKSKEPATTE